MALYHAYGFVKVALTEHAVRRVKIMSTRNINFHAYRFNFDAYYFNYYT